MGWPPNKPQRQYIRGGPATSELRYKNINLPRGSTITDEKIELSTDWLTAILPVLSLPGQSMQRSKQVQQTTLNRKGFCCAWNQGKLAEFSGVRGIFFFFFCKGPSFPVPHTLTCYETYRAFSLSFFPSSQSKYFLIFLTYPTSNVMCPRDFVSRCGIGSENGGRGGGVYI